ncbi:ABC transporter substrate-binding protein [Labrys monachus]|uniref:Ribose transport system substrate-binding protein n=1 Tax=Labrys monachus TaxID=217067 RepID=A0ABU0FLA0_9HYPH|nr:ABC transporter substrate-binding protein [Labrys monachus]MDQ0395374.1 ribose transport system substrate-binding protein [Labrys monachus]
MKTKHLPVAAGLAAAGFLLSTAAFAAEPSVALVLGVKGSPFYQALACGAQAKAKELGLALTVSAPDQFAADSQIPVVNAVAATKPAVAVVVPTDAQALVAPLKQLAGLGTRIVTVDQTVRDNSFVETQIVTDNEQGGKQAADAMNTLLGGKGKVLVITQPPGSAAQDARTTGFEEELKKYAGLDYLGPQYQSDDPQKAAEIVTSTLSAHPDLAGIFSTNDQGAIGALTGLRQAGALGKVKVVAYDAASAEVAAFKNGSIQALIAQNPKVEGEVAMQTALTLTKGGHLDKTTLTEIVTIKAGDTATADKYEYKGDCM